MAQSNSSEEHLNADDEVLVTSSNCSLAHREVSRVDLRDGSALLQNGQQHPWIVPRETEWEKEIGTVLIKILRISKTWPETQKHTCYIKWKALHVSRHDPKKSNERKHVYFCCKAGFLTHFWGKPLVAIWKTAVFWHICVDVFPGLSKELYFTWGHALHPASHKVLTVWSTFLLPHTLSLLGHVLILSSSLFVLLNY